MSLLKADEGTKRSATADRGVSVSVVNEKLVLSKHQKQGCRT